MRPWVHGFDKRIAGKKNSYIILQRLIQLQVVIPWYLNVRGWNVSYKLCAPLPMTSTSALYIVRTAVLLSGHNETS